MIDEKIGIGIITCNREHFLQKCYSSIPSYVDKIIVVNDGHSLTTDVGRAVLIQGNTQPLAKQVGKCKNIAMQYLIENGCEYIFTLEDDIFISDPNVFHNYIKAYKTTGIQHFNFGFSQKENLNNKNEPLYKKVVDYGNGVKIVLTQNILGAFTFYTKECLQTIGLHHSSFNKGHGDHPELTYRAYKHGFTTPFWWFADIYGSWEMIKNQSNMGSDSLVRTQQNFWDNFREARDNFKMLHGVDLLQVPTADEKTVVQLLKRLKK